MGDKTGIEWTDHINPSPTGRLLGAYKTAARRTGSTLLEWMARRRSGEKWCFDCRAWRAATDFSIDRSRAGGLTSRCKGCTSHAATASRYRLSKAALSDMKAQSGGRCAICRRDAKVVVDHRHECGAVRGLLCSACNSGLGLFGDDPAMLHRAAEYLEGFTGATLDGREHKEFPA